MLNSLGRATPEQDAWKIKPFIQENNRQAKQSALAIATSLYLGLPGLRGYWTLVHIDGSGDFLDLGGNGLTLTNNNTVTVVLEDFAPIAYFVRASSNYLSRADATPFDILGGESYINTTYQGLTIGAWVKPSSLPGADMTIAGKWAGSGQASYVLFLNASDKFEFSITTDGSTSVTMASTASAVDDTWHFVVGRYTKSTPKLDLFVNTTTYTNSTSVPASIFNSTSAFAIGATATPSLYWDGFMSHAFLCAAALSDDMVTAIYNKTKGLFGY